MRRIFCVLCLGVLLCAGIARPCHAKFIFDDFDDGNAEDWIIPYNTGLSQGPPQWSVQDGQMVQSYFGDGLVALSEGTNFKSQSVEIDYKTGGYAGVVIWYEQLDSQFANYVAISRNVQTGLWVTEIIDRQLFNVNIAAPRVDGEWCHMRVDADAKKGKLLIFLDDHHGNVYKLTYSVSTSHRAGLSGLLSGNYYSYFDNFSVTSIGSGKVR